MHPSSMFRLDGRVALVTGGSRGIGKMIAAGFVAQPAKPQCASRYAHVSSCYDHRAFQKGQISSRYAALSARYWAVPSRYRANSPHYAQFSSHFPAQPSRY
ncbi:MAG: hypothetical protein B7Y35_09400 [Sphingomonadales bacterium 28-64-96]|nr:MAG: hypothetical protein B7Y35_09400 [Sphingomonadales bacterium 28-64-96]